MPCLIAPIIAFAISFGLPFGLKNLSKLVPGPFVFSIFADI
jgi:hypothetical protein